MEQAILAKLEALEQRLAQFEIATHPRPTSYVDAARGHGQQGVIFRRGGGGSRRFQTHTRTEAGSTTAGTVPRAPVQQRWQRSQNAEFPVLAKRLLNFVQLNRGMQVWSNLPRAVSKLVDDAFYNIVPPMPEPALRERLTTVRDRTKTEVLESIQRHLVAKEEEVKEALRSTNPTDKQRAAGLARSYVFQHFGRKIHPEELHRWMVEALDLVGTTFEQPTIDVPTEPVAVQAPIRTVVTLSRQADWLPAPRSQRKRTVRDIPTSPVPGSSTEIATSNRFDGLPVDTDPVVDEGHDRATSPRPKKADRRRSPQLVLHRVSPPASSPTVTTAAAANEEPERTAVINEVAAPKEQPLEPEPTTAAAAELDFGSFDNVQFVTPEEQPALPVAVESPHRSPGTSTFSATQPARLIGVRPIVHNDLLKCNWSLSLRPDTKTVVIADSNFRMATELPADWEVHVFPGMYLSHTMSLIDTCKDLRTSKRLEHIIVSSGINNRGWAFKNVLPDLNKVFASLTRTGRSTHFLGISVPPDVTEAEKTTLNQINDHALKRFERFYIKPLSADQVIISLTDRYKIHYDQNTINKICSNICNHFLCLPSALPRPRLRSL